MASAINTSALADNNNRFQDNFEIKLTDYEHKNQGAQRKRWTEEKVLEVINSIQNGRVTMIDNQKRSSMEYYWSHKYDVMVVGQEEHLIFKRKSPNDPTVRIIPRNEYFGILYEIHKSCGHGGRDKMIHTIKSRFYIPKKAIEIFVSLCPTCETKKILPKKGIVTRPIVTQDFNIRGQVDLMDFQSFPDGEFKWLLNYQDNATKFISLRPLKNKKAHEVALELMKIFMIFGAPYILQSDNDREFTAKIIEELTSMWPECKIIHGSPRRPQTQGSVERSNQDVENMLRSWMNDNQSRNWSVGCYHVQYKKNSSFHRIIGRTPYKALFGSDPKAGSSNSAIPSSILTYVETEEQLQGLLEQDSTHIENTEELKTVSLTQPNNTYVPVNNLVETNPGLDNTEDLTNLSLIQPNNANIPVDNQVETNPGLENTEDLITISQIQPSNTNDHVVIKVEKIPDLYSEPVVCIEELENIEPNLICVVCHNACSGAHTCVSCKNYVHVICGVSDDEHEGYGAKVICLLCKNEQDIQSERNEAHKGIKRAAEKMVNNTAKKLPPLTIGATVMITIPKIDRGPLDTQNIRGKVIDYRNGVYRVGTKAGIIKNWFARHEIQVSFEELKDDIPDVPISLREAVSQESLFGGQGVQKCICKPAQKQCRTNRCACFKKKVLCGSRCHNSLSCVNK